jgi:hypothetical protein
VIPVTREVQLLQQRRRRHAALLDKAFGRLIARVESTAVVLARRAKFVTISVVKADDLQKTLTGV